MRVLNAAPPGEALIESIDHEGVGVAHVDGKVTFIDGGVTGALYRTSGPRFDAAPWTPVQNTQVGTMTITPSSGNSAQLTYTIDGVTVNKAITRQVFASPMTKCVS